MRAVLPALALLVAAAACRPAATARGGDLASDALPSCPPGTEPHGGAPPHGYHLFCLDADGKRHGPFLQWDDAGRMRLRGHFEHGRRDGHWVQWQLSGEKSSESDYRDDLLHGVEMNWYPNGQLWTRREFRAGKPHGVTVYYRADGTVEGEALYQDGELVKLTQ